MKTETTHRLTGFIAGCFLARSIVPASNIIRDFSSYNLFHVLAVLVSVALGIAYLYGPKKKWIHVVAIAYVGLFTVFTVAANYGWVIGPVLRGAISGNVLNLAGIVIDLFLAVGLIVSVSIVMKCRGNGPNKNAPVNAGEHVD